MLTIAGVRVGLVGVTTVNTPQTTDPRNLVRLQVAPLRDIVEREATRLRAAGATVVVLLAHAGGSCDRYTDPDDLSTCRPQGEIFQLARALRPGLVDVIAAGHAHFGIAHRVNGIAVVEAFQLGRAFSRVDLRSTVRAGPATCASIRRARCATAPRSGTSGRGRRRLRAARVRRSARATRRPDGRGAAQGHRRRQRKREQPLGRGGGARLPAFDTRRVTGEPFRRRPAARLAPRQPTSRSTTRRARAPACHEVRSRTATSTRCSPSTASSPPGRCPRPRSPTPSCEGSRAGRSRSCPASKWT